MAEAAPLKKGALGLKTNRRYGAGVETSLDAARKECVRHKTSSSVVSTLREHGYL
jgi:phage baseplate assembly protein W